MFSPLGLYFLFLVFHLTLSKPGDTQEKSSCVLFFPDLGCFERKTSPQPLSVYFAFTGSFPGGEASLEGEESACHAGNLGLVSW